MTYSPASMAFMFFAGFLFGINLGANLVGHPPFVASIISGVGSLALLFIAVFSYEVRS